MEKERILYVITQGGPWGGAQKYVCDLVTHASQIYDVIVAIGEPEGPPDLQQKLAGICKIVKLPHLVRSISPFPDLVAVRELRNLYKTLNPSIVHLNSSKASIIGAIARIGLHPRPKIVYTVHGWVFNESMGWFKKMLYRKLESITAYWKDKIIVLSEAEKRLAEDTVKLDPHKFAVIPHGIEGPKHLLSKAEAKKSLNLPEDAHYCIGTIANFYPTKGLDILLNAVALLKDRGQLVNLVLIGDGPERKKMEVLKSRLHLDNVHLVGFRDTAAQYLSAFDLFVLPSLKEGLPYTILEAQHAKIPIIATDVGGIPSLVKNQETGLLVPPKDAIALKQATSFALNNPEKMKQMAENAYLQRATHSQETMLSKTIALYQSLLLPEESH